MWFVWLPMRLAPILLVLCACVTVRPPSTERLEATPARLARGAYLATAVSDCVGCHSPRDWSFYLAPVKPGTEGSGNEPFDARMKYPGSIVPSNLTSDPQTGVGTASDGELLRALREGIGRDGRVLFPSMPYRDFRELDDEDAKALVVWMRSLPPVKAERPRTHVNFPVSLFIRSVPRPVEAPVRAPPREDVVATGRYLVTIGWCKECHSPVSMGQVIEEKAFSGGRTLTMPTFTSVTPNLTPYPGTFIAAATREAFIARFKAFEHLGEAPSKAEPGTNSQMAWDRYAQMTPEDLGAIYEYLRTLPPLPGPPAR
jgi:hypothetical protein